MVMDFSKVFNLRFWELTRKKKFFFLGGFSGNIGHDPHLLYTLSAVQILVMYNSLQIVDVEKIVKCKLSIFSSFSKKKKKIRI